MIHPREKFHFAIIFSIFLVFVIALLSLNHTEAYNNWGLFKIVGVFSLPICIPISSLVAVSLISTSMKNITNDEGWVLSKSFGAKHVFFIIPVIIAMVTLTGLRITE